MIRIMALCPDFGDATSFYRAAWPLSRITRENENFSVTLQPSGRDISMGWAEVSQYDVLFLQRPYTDWNLKLLNVANACGVKTWVDYDDDLYHVPYQNRASKTYCEAKTKDTISKIIAGADLVTFSTEKLRETMRGKNGNAHVIRNATDFELVNNQEKKEGKLEKTIFWRGSSTHDFDLLLYAEELRSIAKEFPEWRFIFLGSPWTGILHYIPKTQLVIVPPVRIPEFFGFMLSLKAEIAIVPLEDCTFNHCKSNIAWQEATLGGMASLVPQWKEWKVPGAITYGSVKAFGEKLKTLILNESMRKDAARRSKESLETCYNLTDANHARVKLLEKLCYG